VECRPDAFVSLRSAHNQATDVAIIEYGLEVGLLERVGVPLGDNRLGGAVTQFRNELPTLAVDWHVLAGVLHPDNRHILGPRLVDQKAYVGDNGVPVVDAGHDVVLHVDDE
jgi:hypothetical protein